MSKTVCAQAVRMVLDHQGEHSSRWAAVSSIAAKIGCTTQTLNECDHLGYQQPLT
jgi:transposase